MDTSVNISLIRRSVQWKGIIEDKEPSDFLVLILESNPLITA